MLNIKNTTLFTTSLFLILVTTLIYSFFSDYGLRDDEGFYFYYLKHGIGEPTFTFFHTLGNLFGPLFSFNLIGFRILNLILILISVNLALIFGYQYYFDTFSFNDKKMYLLSILVSISSLGFFCFIPTFSYTSSATIACFLWASTIFYICKEYRKVDFLFYLLLFFTFLFSISSRIQMFTVSISFLILFLFLIKNYINQERSLSIFKIGIFLILLTSAFTLLHMHFIIEIYPIGKIIYKTTHDSLLLFYLSNVLYVFTHQDFYIVYLTLFLITIFLFIKIRFNKDININLLIGLILILASKDIYGFSKSYFDIAGTPSNYSNRAIRYLFIISIFTPLLIEYYIALKAKLDGKLYKINKNFILIFLVALLGTVFSSLGNNSNLVFWASFSIGLTSVPFFLRIFIIDEKKSLRYLLLVACIFFTTNLSIIYREQIYQFRRSPIKSKEFLSSKSNFLNGVKVDPYSANVINIFLTTLNKIKFNYDTDRIFAYPELPGLVATSSAKSFGDVHNQHEFSKVGFRELKAIEDKICAFIDNENLQYTENVYILNGEEIPAKIRECLFNTIDKNSIVETYRLGVLKNIGMAFNDYKESLTEITLTGPYKLIK